MLISIYVDDKIVERRNSRADDEMRGSRLPNLGGFCLLLIRPTSFLNDSLNMAVMVDVVAFV